MFIHIIHISSQMARFSKNVIEYKIVIRVYLQYLSEIFVIPRRTVKDMIKNDIGLHVKYPLFLSDFKETLIFSSEFLKILKCKTSRKSGQWEPRYSMRTEERTDMTKVLVAFRNSANSPKEETIPPKSHKNSHNISFTGEEKAPFYILQML
jgi:hypothetical protein